LQREIASRINARVLTLHAGHVPFLSKPKETADVILAAVDFVRGKGLGGHSIVEPGDRE
jgi:hypothetical protein